VIYSAWFVIGLVLGGAICWLTVYLMRMRFEERIVALERRVDFLLVQNDSLQQKISPSGPTKW